MAWGTQPRRLLKACRRGQCGLAEELKESRSFGGQSGGEMGSADWAQWHRLAKRTLQRPMSPLHTEPTGGREPGDPGQPGWSPPSPEHDLDCLVIVGTEGLSVATQEKSPSRWLEERETLNNRPDSPWTFGGQQDSQEPAGWKAALSPRPRGASWLFGPWGRREWGGGKGWGGGVERPEGAPFHLSAC